MLPAGVQTVETETLRVKLVFTHKPH